MGHFTRTPLTADDLHRIEFHGSFDWLTSVAFDFQNENPSLPVWLVDSAEALEEAAQVLRAQAVSALRAHGRSVRDIEKEIDLSKSSVDRVNQLGAYELSTDDSDLQALANAVMAKVWEIGLASGRWADQVLPEPVSPKAISAQLVRRWIRDAGIDTEGMTIEDLIETMSVEDEETAGETGRDSDTVDAGYHDEVVHYVVIPDLDDERRRAVRKLLFERVGLNLTGLSNARGTDRWSVKGPEDID